MEERHLDALRRIGQADESWSRAGHQPVLFQLLHTGGMNSEIDHPGWDESWATPDEQTLDDLAELGFLRVEPHFDKRRSFYLTMNGREVSRQMREEVGMPVARDQRQTVAAESAAAAEREIDLFLIRVGGDVFSVDQLADAVANRKFDQRAAVQALRSLRAAGRVEPRGGGWQVMGDGKVRYHVRVIPLRAADLLAGSLYEYDLSESEVLGRFVAPYQEHRVIAAGGRELASYRKPQITMTVLPGSEAVAKIAAGLNGSEAGDVDRMASEEFFERASKDVTAKFIDPSQPATIDNSAVPAATPPADPPRGEIFIVHGHSRRDEVDLFLRNATGVRPVILADKAGKGRTIIEKFEQESDSSSFAVVLLTADDLGRSKLAPEEALAPRARQNVILELGYFFARLGRERVVALYDEGVELPSDYSGVEFISFIDDWQLKLIRELREAGFEIDTEGL